MLRPNQLGRALARRIGYDLVRVKHSPPVNLLGLRNYPIRSILDIGANVGQFARELGAEFPDAHVYCFEPLPDAYRKLATWAKSQGDKVTTYNVALGDKPGTVDMFHHVDFSQSSSILQTTAESTSRYERTRRQEPVTVEVKTLDSIAPTLEPPLRPDLLVKADVQGYEEHVIRGGEATLRQARACLIEACLEPLYQGQASFAQLVERLTALDFEYAGNLVQYCRDDGHVMFVDALFLNRGP